MEKDLEEAFLTIWNGTVENREDFCMHGKTDTGRGRIGEMTGGKIMQLTVESPLDTICLEILNMAFESMKIHGNRLLHFHSFDDVNLEIKTEEE